MSLAKRRHDLIPNLVAAVKGHSGYEKGTLESVVDLRGVPSDTTGWPTTRPERSCPRPRPLIGPARTARIRSMLP